ncbi:bifunctional phosphopantothenoylcysteine decarboxylase/phosphopantothenate--cysteine ligase CoaBC [Arthrobacter sp. JZ12]|uniref:bifunctional phosphopantothenoylcysteine decarboxylase/phosphopantothenate--cysteine ligase CoaBC n=1 Tax=Arthrobacter sp. JZ12 TaxID=2654190 RepID=UPI002B4A5525|nr:bifunctional phosphopantothenoylcysteine decarboxylase/phosphopantothenate--cysteine ligase CoaBC [Arthrobacter sp. JZ12]WRH25019.1 bifunctional phosphopantothenoylcysteine decarboxylase/phosphopantothenate--cysteine ligase CoaBC [Arthrobacter sp. JZ12]
MRIVLGVGGGIAAYKVASLLRLFTEAGHSVTVIPTEASRQFVGTATWEALSGNPISNSVFDAVDQVRHVRLGQEADLVVIAPATADLLARAASGMANDLLTGTLLVSRAPVLFAPAMHTEMWLHPATQANVALLRERGAVVLEPAVGRLTGADSGPGRLPEPEEIFAAALRAAEPSTTFPAHGSLSGRTITITAGGTREPLDPVRFLGNRSSGKQGVALAEAALSAGASVRFIAAHLEVPPPAGVDLTVVETALELREATLQQARDCDVLIMAAAVADFRAQSVSDTKVKKRDDGENPVIVLERNPDILAEAVEQRRNLGGPAVIVGFAAETGDDEGTPLAHGERKLKRKGCDLLVLNRVGRSLVFGQDTTEVTILDAGGAEPETAAGSKSEVAKVVLARIAASLGASN